LFVLLCGGCVGVFVVVGGINDVGWGGGGGGGGEGCSSPRLPQLVRL